MSRDVTATSRRPHPGTSRRPGHDGHATATTGTDMIAYKGTCPRDTTRHAKTQSHKRSNVAPCNKHPRGGVSPRRKKQGRWLSSADAECSLEHFWITRYSRSLTYLVAATVAAPYILCIMFLGLMLMAVERSSGPHRYLAAITHCA